MTSGTARCQQVLTMRGIRFQVWVRRGAGRFYENDGWSAV